ncbi:MAG: DegT/DnrJ/EryC1/StrS family aminotransferase [Lentisphaerae bacterium]|nr:DegT/DnrJ/EryC1/StrS family aminotransferase [Lentisphaerota bacterium]
MQVPLLDLKAQYGTIRREIEEAVSEVFESQQFILGPTVAECEEAFARYGSCQFAVGVSSGTDALLASLMAEGIGHGDEVITTPFTFFATAGSITRTGAVPVFVDIRPDTFNIDVSRIEEVVTERTKAILPVHLFGQMAEMDPLLAIARKHGLCVIEDAAQAIGSERDGCRAGTVGEYGCFSFFPSKNLGGAGDGGMVVTGDPARAELLRTLRVHGSSARYHHEIVGGNFRLDALQAAVLLVKLRHLDDWTAARQANADRYDGMFRDAFPGGDGPVSPPVRVAGRHVFNQYVIRVERRDELRRFLGEEGVGAAVYYPVPLHLQECFSGLGYGEGAFPESEKAANEVLALPVYPELTEDQARYVVERVTSFFSS